MLNRFEFGRRNSWLYAVRELPGALVDLVFPPLCHLCNVPLPEVGRDRSGLCATCIRQITYRPVNACRTCGAEVPPEVGQVASCPLCVHFRLRFDSAATLGVYEDDLRDAVLAMKDRRSEHLTQAIARLMADQLGEFVRACGPDFIAPVPMHWQRRWKRGTSSPELLAEVLGGELRLACARRLLKCRRKMLQQSKLPPSRRQANVRGAFAVRPGYDLADAHVLVVDDILTTGLTCSEVARTLKRNGAARVTVLAVARGGTR